ncbi:MAG: hypothetical protein KF833_10245 [Verrucomicrobiae bacterium]|nr:hypothetical protein [Verrucomicrobiae bacterium]
MSSRSDNFGFEFAERFSRESAKVRFFEVPLFRALVSSLSSVSNSVQVEELHGSRSQVLFSACPPWTRRIARCELADVCIIWFRLGRQPQVRITFMQAKRSNHSHALCEKSPPVPKQAFNGDSTQFHLLTTRPKIVGRFQTFDPPAHLLSNAVLPSVGSYCVFHRAPDGTKQFFYASAAILTADAPSSPGRITIETQFGVPVQHHGSYPERKWACCPMVFGSAIHSGQIGTPLESDRIALGWVSSFVSRAASTIVGDEGRVSRAFLGAFDVPGNNDRAEAPAKRILLIQTEPEQSD